uniref:Uncharacterized protein n=1 Tax=Anopheles culicifacies TaxID=139723 RepID=A0A182ME91_9DIPT
MVGVADGVPVDMDDTVDVPDALITLPGPFRATLDSGTPLPTFPAVPPTEGVCPPPVCCDGFVLMKVSYSRPRIISRVCRHDSRTRFCFVSLRAAVTYSRTCVFCFCITWYRVGFSSFVSTCSTFFGSSISMFSSGSRTESTGGPGDVTIDLGPCSLFLICSRNSCCFSCVRDEMFSCEKLVLCVREKIDRQRGGNTLHNTPNHHNQALDIAKGGKGRTY